jgi:hypothetical protein
MKSLLFPTTFSHLFNFLFANLNRWGNSKRSRVCNLFVMGLLLVGGLPGVTVQADVLPSVREPLNSVTLNPGESSTWIAIMDGTQPFSFQWQVSTDGSRTWKDIPGATGQSFSIGGGTQDMDKNRYRVKISNNYGEVISNSFTLTVLGASGIPEGMVRVGGNGSSLSTFYIGRTEVFWMEWLKVRAWAAENDFDIGAAGRSCGLDHPVRYVSWYDVLKWCNAKSLMEGLIPVYMVEGAVYKKGQFGWSGSDVIQKNHEANGYRLPTESEWVYAAQGGADSNGTVFSGGNYLGSVGWFVENSSGGTCNLTAGRGTWQVGLKEPNELGIYDMSGNVFEWCWDAHQAPFHGFILRGARGGAWTANADQCEISYEHSIIPSYLNNDVGFRIVTNLEPPVIVNHPQNMNLQLPDEIGSFTVVAAGDGLRYQWQMSSTNGNSWSDIMGANSEYYRLERPNFLMSGYFYRVVISNGVGVVKSLPALLTLSEAITAPGIFSHPANRSVLAPDSALFIVNATGTAPLIYQWQRSTDNGVTWTNLSGATSESYSTGATTTTMNGYRYRVLVSNSAGSVISNAANLEVTEPVIVPEINSHPVNQTVMVPNSAIFSVSVSGTEPMNYQWQRSTNNGGTWSNLGGATSASYSTGATTTTMNGYRYRVIVSNNAGSVTSHFAVLSVPPPVPVIIVHPVNRTRPAPESASFNVTAIGALPLFYLWQRSTNDGELWDDLEDATSETYNTGATTMAMNGYRYRVVVSNSAGATISDPATLTVVGGSTEVSRGAFGTMRQVDTNRFISDDFGELNFGGGGLDFTRAFSSSLQADLQEQNGLIFSDLYGVLRPNPWGLPQWIISDYFGLIHFGEEGDQYAGWVSSERFGWMRFVDAGGGDRFLWVHHLQTWMAVNPGGGFHSFDFGWLVPEPGSLNRYNSRIGVLIGDEHNPDGWLRSDRFGFVWFARDGTGVWFWSSSRNEWIGITQEGGLWSTAEGRFL